MEIYLISVTNISNTKNNNRTSVTCSSCLSVRDANDQEKAEKCNFLTGQRKVIEFQKVIREILNTKQGKCHKS